MGCLNSLVLANHKQPFIANMLKLVDSTPLYSLMLICVNNQSIEWPPKTSNREKLVTLIIITEATGSGLCNSIRQRTLTRALRFYPNQFHTSAMKKCNIINKMRKSHQYRNILTQLPLCT